MHRTRFPDLLVLAFLDDPHTATAAQSACTSLEHGGCIFDGPDASTGLDLHSVAICAFVCQMVACSTHESDMLDLSAMAQEARRCLYKVEIRRRCNSARSNNIPVSQLRSLKDEFENRRGRSHGSYEREFVVDFAVFLLFEQWPVDDDVEFVGAGRQGHACFLQFVVCVLGALVEADDAGDQHIAAFEVGVGLGDIVGSDADALGGIVLASFAGSRVDERNIQQSWRLGPLHTARRFAWGKRPV